MFTLRSHPYLQYRYHHLILSYIDMIHTVETKLSILGLNPDVEQDDVTESYQKNHSLILAMKNKLRDLKHL